VVLLATIEEALCQMLEKTLLDSGLDPDIAKILSRAGCERLVKPAGARVRSKVSKVTKKTKRKVSGYQREVGRQLKALKKKHPRTDVTRLMKKAHRAAKKVRK
jgi:DNA relaxase NicK